MLQLFEYTAAKLKELFQKFDEVEDVIKTRKLRSKGSAIVVLGSKAVSPD
jgi:DnaJ homolog subfamily C member 17